MAKPPFMAYYYDPAFRSKSIRISDSKADEVIKPAYSTMQAWNADESLMILYKSGPDGTAHQLLDGHTYRYIKDLDFLPADLEEVFWSHSDPDAFFYTSKRKGEIGGLYKWSIRKDKGYLLKNFSEFCGLNSLPVAGQGVHMQSLDDDVFGFRCRNLESKEKKYRMITYRISTDETTVAELGPGTKWHNWTAPTPTPSGKNFWLQGYTVEEDLKTIIVKHDMGNVREHSSIGQTYNGLDAMYQVAFDPSPNGCDGDKYEGVGHLTEWNLQTGECRPIINQKKGYPYPTSGTHVSAIAYKAPGWVALSSIGNQDQMKLIKSGKPVPVLLSEIYMANTDPKNEVVCRLAHHRSTGKNATNGNYHAYFGEPHVTISPSGTRLLYGSDWYDSGSVDSYVIELPGYKKP